MRRPFLYRAHGQADKNQKNRLKFFILIILIMYIVSIIHYRGNLCGESVSKILHFIIFIFPGILFTNFVTGQILWNPSIHIDAISNKTTLNLGRKQIKINSNQIKSVEYTDSLIELTMKKDKKIKINSENFPKIKMQGLASYFISIINDNSEIKNEFFEHEDSGFKVFKKTVIETPNPWPQVFLIFFACFVVVMIFYWIFNLIFT